MRPQVVSFNCILKNKAGKLISSTYNRDVLTSVENGQNIFLYGLAKNLQNLKKGERRLINVSAEEAYGFYDPQKVILYPRYKLPKLLKIGELINIIHGTGYNHSYRVVNLEPQYVSLDGNHPLAGQDLVFEIETLEVRDATPQEIEESNNTVYKQLLH